MSHLYAGSILKIDLSTRAVSREPTDSYTKSFLGGRGINIKLFYDHILPGIDALGPENVLVFGVGPLGGTSISSAANLNSLDSTTSSLKEKRKSRSTSGLRMSE